ncbi:MAG: hypothetical protein EBZ48_02460 [Proteobacteria bacterium]|nr:hypothetical protein [Pseudomonadota bacterium]
MCAVALAGLLLLVARLVLNERLPAVYVERIQLVVFPLMVASLWFARFGQFQLPRVVLVSAAVAGAVVTAHGYELIPSKAHNNLTFSRLQDDPDESASRLFRERVEVMLEKGSPERIASDRSLQRHFKSFARDRDLRELFKEDPALQAVVWGDSTLVRLSMRERPPVSLSQFEQALLAPRTRQFALVDSVSVVALAFEPKESTAFFVARLFEALAHPLDPASPQFEEAYRANHLILQLAADQAYRYPTRVHRSFPQWRLGTNSILMYLRSGATQIGYLECARASLEKGLAMMASKENPDLAAAILNNLGVVALLRGEALGDQQMFRIAKRYFDRALKTVRHRPVNGEIPTAVLVARSNFTVLTGRVLGKKSGKPKRK